MNNYKRVVNAMEKLADIPLSRLTVGDMLFIEDSQQEIRKYPPMWHDVAATYADNLERILRSANAEKPQPTNE